MKKFREYVNTRFPEEFSEAEIVDLFNRLDSTHDGLLDINELSSSVYQNYKDYLMPERQFWDKIATVPWIDKNQLLDNFKDDEETQEKLKGVMKKMNIEFNPNLTFWQYIRSADDDTGKEFRDIINTKKLTPVNPLIIEEEDNLNINTPRAKVRVDTSKSYTPSSARGLPKKTITKTKKEPALKPKVEKTSKKKRYSKPSRPTNITSHHRHHNLFPTRTYERVIHPQIRRPGDEYTITGNFNPVTTIRTSFFSPINPFERSLSPYIPHPAHPGYNVRRSRSPISQNKKKPPRNVRKNTVKHYKTPPRKNTKTTTYSRYRRTEPPSYYGRDLERSTDFGDYHRPKRNGDYGRRDLDRSVDYRRSRHTVDFNETDPGRSVTITGQFSTEPKPKEKYVYEWDDRNDDDSPGKFFLFLNCFRRCCEPGDGDA